MDTEPWRASRALGGLDSQVDAGAGGGVNPVFTIKTLPRPVLKFLKSCSTNFRS